MRTSLYRWFEEHVWAGDAIFGGLLAVVLIVNSTAFRDREPAVVALLLVSAGPMFIRRSSPRAAVVSAIVLLVLNVVFVDRVTFAVVLAPVFVHASVAHISERSWGRTALAIGLVGSVLAPVRWGYAQSEPTVLAMAVGLCAVIVLAAFVVGERQRDRDENQVRQIRSFAERASILAAERDQRVKVAAADERARIARELHDIVAHSLSVVIVQADGAAAAVAAQPHLGPEVLSTIAETGREALGEMRRLVGILRTDDSEAADFAPSQGVEDLPALIGQMRRTGMTIDVVSAPGLIPLPPGLGLTVYRIVQEGLTNVLKHAGPRASAQVEVTHLRDALTVTVIDDGRGQATGGWESEPGGEDPGDDVFDPKRPVAGHGLMGMRERVQLQGGSLSAGPMAGGGFCVSARFDLAERRGTH